MQLATDRMIAEKESGIGWMTFNSPERRNAISIEMRHAILEIYADFAADDAVRVVVLKGAGGKAFVSGADISEFEKERNTEEQRRAYSALSERVNEALTSMEKPVIAMINGFCLGGGLGTALSADIRIAADDAQFGIPAARMGLGYPFRGLKALVDLVGPACAKEIMFTARRFSAEEALGMGLINRVVPVAELEDTVREMASGIAQNAPLTVRASKTIIGEALKDADSRNMELCASLAEACMASEDYKEGRRAFMEKRKPAFVGR